MIRSAYHDLWDARLRAGYAHASRIAVGGEFAAFAANLERAMAAIAVSAEEMADRITRAFASLERALVAGQERDRARSRAAVHPRRAFR